MVPSAIELFLNLIMLNKYTWMLDCLVEYFDDGDGEVTREETHEDREHHPRDVPLTLLRVQG